MDFLLRPQRIGKALVLGPSEYLPPIPTVPARTAGDLVKRAMRLVGAYGSGDHIGGTDSSDALLALNMMLDAWSADDLFVYQTMELQFDMVAGQGVYTVGPSGDFKTARPVSIQYAFTRDPQNIDRFLTISAQDDYASITLKNIGNTYPMLVTSDNAYPNATITFYPYPVGGLTVFLGMTQPLLGYPELSDPVSLPPGYEEAITFSLAEQIALEYDRPIPPMVLRTAALGRGRIKSLNLPTPTNAVEFTGVGYRGGDGKAAFLGGY